MVKLLIAVHLAGWFVYMFCAWWHEYGRYRPGMPSHELINELVIGFTWEFSIVPGLIATFARGILTRHEK